MSRLLAIALGAGLMGCTHSVHVNHTSDFQTNKPLSEYRIVESRSQQTVMMGMAGDTFYADEAYKSLMEQCPDGSVTGIQTRYSTSHNFFSWTNVVVMQGYCSN